MNWLRPCDSEFVKSKKVTSWRQEQRWGSGEVKHFHFQKWHFRSHVFIDLKLSLPFQYIRCFYFHSLRIHCLYFRFCYFYKKHSQSAPNLVQFSQPKRVRLLLILEEGANGMRISWLDNSPLEASSLDESCLLLCQGSEKAWLFTICMNDEQHYYLNTIKDESLKKFHWCLQLFSFT